MGVLECKKKSKTKEESPLNSSIDKTSVLYIVEVILKPAKIKNLWNLTLTKLIMYNWQIDPSINDINNVQLFSYFAECQIFVQIFLFCLEK